MDTEGFNESSCTLKEFTKPYVHYKECEPKVTEKTSAAYEIHSKRGGEAQGQTKGKQKGLL
eukprot:9359827-Ditylum_brightwellii.AAC.2